MKTIYKTLIAGGAGLIISASTMAEYSALTVTSSATPELAAATRAANIVSYMLDGQCGSAFLGEVVEQANADYSAASSKSSVFDTTIGRTVTLTATMLTSLKDTPLGDQLTDAGVIRTCQSGATLKFGSNQTAASSTSGGTLLGVRIYDPQVVLTVGAACNESLLDDAVFIMSTLDSSSAATAPISCKMHVYPAGVTGVDNVQNFCDDIQAKISGHDIQCLTQYSSGTGGSAL